MNPNRQNNMKDDSNNDRKDFRRENLTKKKFLDKKQKLDDEFIESKKKSNFKQKKQEIDEEEWEDWDRYYNH
jgi:hypothetical protein